MRSFGNLEEHISNSASFSSKHFIFLEVTLKAGKEFQARKIFDEDTDFGMRIHVCITNGI